MPREASADGLARLAALERAMQAMVAAAGGSEAIARAQAEQFAGFGLDARDAEALAAAPTRQLNVYRRLVRGTFLECVRLEMPAAADRLGPLYDEYVHAFCTEELPRSPILRDSAFELARWALPRWLADARVAPWIADLARFELLDFDVHCAERDGRAPDGEELPADKPLLFDGSVRLGRFDWAVHDDEAEPKREPTGLLLYRDEKNVVRRMTLTPLATRILEKLLIDELPFAAGVAAGCAAEGRAVDADVIAGISRVLADLAERGALKGAAPPQPRKRPPWLGWLYDARTDYPPGG